MDRLQLLHVTPSYFPAHRYGGPSASLHALALAQQAAGVQVRVLTSNAAGGGQGETLPLPTGRYVTPHDVPTFYGAVRLGEDISAQLLAELPRSAAWAQLVHVTALWSPTSLAALSYALLPHPSRLGTRLRAGRPLPPYRPVVLSPRGALLPWAMAQRAERKTAVLRVLRPLLRRVAGWHATSQAEAEAITRLRLLGPQAELSVVGNGVNLPVLDAVPDVVTQDLLRRIDALPAPHVLALGRIHPVKNLELAVAALVRLRRLPGCEQATLLLAGPERVGDPYGDTLRAQAAAAGVSDAVQFLGLVSGPSKDALLARADLLWLPSHMESFGNVVVEALAAGTPVLAANSTPWQELEAQRVGRCLPAEPEAFAQATAQLLRLYPRESFRERCRTVAAERYSWYGVQAQLQCLYDTVLARHADLLG